MGKNAVVVWPVAAVFATKMVLACVHVGNEETEGASLAMETPMRCWNRFSIGNSVGQRLTSMNVNVEPDSLGETKDSRVGVLPYLAALVPSVVARTVAENEEQTNDNAQGSNDRVARLPMTAKEEVGDSNDSCINGDGNDTGSDTREDRARNTEAILDKRHATEL